MGDVVEEPDPESRGGGHSPPPRGDAHDLARLFDPILHRATESRLGHIEWFRSQHQRGGAATGFSTWTLADGRETPVFVKFPVGPAEHRWTVALGACDPAHWDDRWSRASPTPRVLASGTQLGGYDLAWIIVERLEGPSLARGLDEAGATSLLRAAADFQAAAMKVAPLGPCPPSPDWERTLERSRELARAGGFAESQKWNEAIKKIQRALPILRRRWESRPINAWCHGDLHPGNVMRRASEAESVCVLIDLALVHSGHWAEDALYLERQFWGREKQLGIKPVSVLAKFRRERGLAAEDGYGDLAMVRRVLTAGCAPALLDREGNPRYLHAALDVIERCLPQACKL